MSNARELARTWQAVVGRLQVDIARPTFETFVLPTRAIDFGEGCVIVETAHPLHLGTLNDSIRQSARMVLYALTGEDLDIRFVASGERPAQWSQSNDGAHAQAPGTVIGGVNRRYTLDSYLPAQGNSLARTACLALLEDVDAPAPVAIWGAPGVGKTHLLHGLALRAVNAGVSTACLSAESFTSGFQRALRKKEADVFTEALRDVDLLIVDDLQQFVNRPATQEVLMHTVDAVHNSGGHVVVAGEVHPLQLALPDSLTTRFASGVVAAIEPFEAAERRAFVECVARNLRAALPAWAIDRIVALGDVPVRILRGAVTTAVAQQRDGSLSMGKLDLALGKLIVLNHAQPETSPAEIIAAVAAHFGSSPSEIRGRSRKPDVVNARAVAAAALRARGLSLTEMATELGRDRSTLSPIVRRGQQLLANAPALHQRLAG